MCGYINSLNHWWDSRAGCRLLLLQDVLCFPHLITFCCFKGGTSSLRLRTPFYSKDHHMHSTTGHMWWTSPSERALHKWGEEKLKVFLILRGCTKGCFLLFCDFGGWGVTFIYGFFFRVVSSMTFDLSHVVHGLNYMTPRISCWNLSTQDLNREGSDHFSLFTVYLLQEVTTDVLLTVSDLL